MCCVLRVQSKQKAMLHTPAFGQVCGPGEVASSYRQVAGEVPGSPIFAMKLAPQSRHLEVRALMIS
jgi:hypothetical protein